MSIANATGPSSRLRSRNVTHASHRQWGQRMHRTGNWQTGIMISLLALLIILQNNINMSSSSPYLQPTP
jgi:hypothetical protein